MEAGKYIVGERIGGGGMADVFRAAGYTTASFVTNVYAGPRSAMDQGFEFFTDKIGFSTSHYWELTSKISFKSKPLTSV